MILNKADKNQIQSEWNRDEKGEAEQEQQEFAFQYKIECAKNLYSYPEQPINCNCLYAMPL